MTEKELIAAAAARLGLEPEQLLRAYVWATRVQVFSPDGVKHTFYRAELEKEPRPATIPKRKPMHTRKD